MKIQKRIFTLLALAMLIFSCGSSIEGQLSRWETEQKKANTYAVKYPGLKEVILHQLNIASDSIKIAQEIQNEEKQIDALRRANKLATKGPVKLLISFEEALSAVKKDVNKVKNEFSSEEFTAKTNFLLTDANRAIDNAERIGKTNYSDARTMLLELASAVKNLKTFEESVENHYKQVVDARPEPTQSQSTDKAKESKTASKTERAKANKKCKRCGSLASHNVTKCKSCGSPFKN